MNEVNKKRRASILKKRQSTEDDQTEITVNKFPKRNQIQFSQKKQVKEFLQCEENVTIWGNTYETSVAKSDGSDGSSTSQKINVDFSHSTINVTNNEATSMIESEKENIIIEKPRISEESRGSISNISSSASSSVDFTIDMNASEKKRINKYGTDNLNITNMQLDTSTVVSNNRLNVPTISSKKVLSPRKMIFLNKNSKTSFVVQDKVLMNPADSIDDNVSVSLEDDENPASMKTNPPRKTISQPVDMNISIERKEPQKNFNVKSNCTTMQIENMQTSYAAPAVFKLPELPKTFKFQPQNFDSPPIKPMNLENAKKEVDELLDMMVSDTPSKNLCCTHTPNKSAHPTTMLRKSNDIFKEVGLFDDEKCNSKKSRPVRRTIFHDDSIKLDDSRDTEKENRKTTFEKVQMDATMELDINNKIQNLDMSLAMSMIQQQLQKSGIFELDEETTIPRNIQFSVKPLEYEFEKSLKRSTLSNDTCNATNLIMQLTNIDDTGGSIDTTEEIQRKATRLLKNPNMTLGSSSTINSPFPEEHTDPNANKSLQIHKSSNSVFEKEIANADMDISGIESSKKLPTISAKSLTMPRAEHSKVVPEITGKSINNRITTYNLNQMDISPGNSTQLSNLRISLHEVHISPKELRHDEKSQTKILSTQSSLNFESNEIFEKSTKRTTTYNMDISGIDLTENLPKTFQQNSSTASASNDEMYTSSNSNKPSEIQKESKRMTTYANDMNLSVTEDRNLRKSVTKTHHDSKRATTYNVNQMDITHIETAPNQKYQIYEDVEHDRPNNKNRMTTYAQTMDMSCSQEATDSISSKSSGTHLNFKGIASKKDRVTIYSANKMDISDCEPTATADYKLTQKSDEIDKFSDNKKRVTTYNMNITSIEACDQVPTVSNQVSLKTHSMNDNVNNVDVTGSDLKHMDKTGCDLKHMNITGCNLKHIDVTGCDLNNHSKHMDVIPNKNNKRGTTYAHHMDMSDCDIKTAPESDDLAKPKRMTTYANEMNLSNADLPQKRTTIFNVNEMETSHMGLPAEPVQSPSMDISGNQLFNEIFDPPHEFHTATINQKIRLTMHNVDNVDVSGSDDCISLTQSPIIICTDDELRESPIHKKRATTYTKGQMEISISDRNRATIYNVDMSSCEQVQQKDRRGTFTVTKTKKRESLKWHDLTDADFSNLIDDESNPCLQDISSSVPVSSDASYVSKHAEAVEDFCNLTIRASPLNQSIFDCVKTQSRRQSRIPSPVRDFSCMLEDLVVNLRKTTKPRLEIDEYLEKLNIQARKIKRYAQNQEGYVEEKLSQLLLEQSNRQEERIRMRKEIENTQFPQIPSAKFLMENYIECMGEEIRKNRRLNAPLPPPLYPARPSFEYLMHNKFVTDDHLQQYWYYDSSYWHKGRIKLTHKKMPMFTIIFKCEQYMSKADESTIPIIFREVMLFLTPEYRRANSQTRRNMMLRTEFHRVLNGVDCFTSICESSEQLFSFLDYYHINVMKAVEIVDNFFSIVHKYRAIYLVAPAAPCNMVFKRCFLADDTVDIQIAIDGYLQDITLQHLNVKGRQYSYNLIPHFNTNDLNGLMLIELILFNTEKFLQMNIQRIMLNDDE